MAHVIHSWGHVSVQLGGKGLAVIALVPQVHGDLAAIVNADAVMVQNATTKRVCITINSG